MRLAALVPLGVPIHGFRLPRFDDTGRLVSFIEVDELRRVSSDRFALREVRVRLYNAEGEEMRRIETPQARLYLKHGLLAGDHQVTISRTNRPEPESVGRGFVYDLDTQVWSLLSEVTTRIPVSPATPGSATP